jgi:hypothetical protein
LAAASADALDGEEITNKNPGDLRRVGEASKANHRLHENRLHEMCLIHLDFKHFRAAETEEFRQHCKVSSIMPIEGRPVTAD